MTGDVPGSRRGLRLSGGALVILLLAGAAVSAAAPQSRSRPAKASSSSSEGTDLFLGYSLVKAGSARLHGGQLSISHPFWRSISLVGDLSGHFGSYAGADLRQYELLAGGRRYWRWNSFRPYAEVLVGVVRHETSVGTSEGEIKSTGTDFAVAPGVGADYGLTDAWSARAALDLLLVRGGGWEADPRFSLGVVYRFGR